MSDPRRKFRGRTINLPTIGQWLSSSLTPNGISSYSELVSPLLSFRQTFAKLTKIERLSQDAALFTLTPNRLWRGNKAGQYVPLGVVIDGVRHIRYYSPLSGSAAKERITLGISRHPRGVVSGHMLDSARVNDVFSLGEAAGTFTLPEILPSQLRLFSAGSGFTTIVAFLEELIARRYQGTVLIIHYGATAQSIAPKLVLHSLASQLPNAQLHFGITQETLIPNDPYPYILGRVSETQLPILRDRTVTTYACGPQGFITAVAQLTEPANFRSETFTPYLAAALPEDGETLTLPMQCTKSAVTIDASSGDTILNAALKAGLSPEYGCKMGICFSCSSVKKSGVVRNIITGERNDDPDTLIQPCINFPLTPIEIEL